MNEKFKLRMNNAYLIGEMYFKIYFMNEMGRHHCENGVSMIILLIIIRTATILPIVYLARSSANSDVCWTIVGGLAVRKP